MKESVKRPSGKTRSESQRNALIDEKSSIDRMGQESQVVNDVNEEKREFTDYVDSFFHAETVVEHPSAAVADDQKIFDAVPKTEPLLTQSILTYTGNTFMQQDNVINAFRID